MIAAPAMPPAAIAPPVKTARRVIVSPSKYPGGLTGGSDGVTAAPSAPFAVTGRLMGVPSAN